MLLATQDRPMESAEPMKVAGFLLRNAFSVPGGRQGLWNHREAFYQWYGNKWQVRDYLWLEDACWSYLEDAYYRATAQNGEVISRRYHPNKSKIENVVRALEARVRLPHSKVPVWLGTEPRNVDTTIAFEDVLVDAKTMQVTERDERWFDPVTIPCEWDPDAKCPKWMECINEWSEGDPVWCNLLQRWMGYCLMPHRKHAKWLLMYGKVRAGKGTIGKILEKMIGTDCFMGTSLDDIAGDFGLDGLEHSRVLCVSEVSELDNRMGEKATRVLKNIVGQDPISVNIKFKRQMRNIVVDAAPMVQANEIPQLPNKGRGLSSKMLVLPFEVTFEGKENHNLIDELEAEIPGIAAWAVAGANKVETAPSPKDRFPAPRKAEDAVKLYHLQNNPFDHFLEERFLKNPQGFVATEMVWSQWVDWLERNGVKGVHVPRNQIALQIESQSSWNVYRHRPSADSKRGLKGLSLRRNYEDLS